MRLLLQLLIVGLMHGGFVTSQGKSLNALLLQHVSRPFVSVRTPTDHVFPAGSNICTATTNTVKSQSDADALSSCETLSGNVVIGENFSGDVSLNGIGIIQGNLTAENVTQLTSIYAGNLTAVNGAFVLSDITILTTIHFPRLVFINTFSLIGIPALQGFLFESGVTCNDVLVSNTQLITLEGLNIVSVDTFDVNNNPYLTNVTTPFTKATQVLTLAANGRNLQVSFPNLQTAANVTIRNVSSIDMPQLMTVTSSLVFGSNTIQSLSLPSLQRIQGNFSIADSGSMNNISTPILAAVSQDLNFSGLSNVNAISLPQLGSISGSAVFSGGFNQLALPALTNAGNITIDTTGALDCNRTAPTSAINHSSYNCSSADSTLYLAPSGSSTTPSPAPSSSAPSSSALTGSGLTTAGKIGVGVGVGVGVPVLAAIIAFFVLRRRKAKRAQMEDDLLHTKPELSTATEIPRKEMSEGRRQEGGELDGVETRREKVEADSHERVEAPGDNPLMEMNAAPESNFVHEMPNSP